MIWPHLNPRHGGLVPTVSGLAEIGCASSENHPRHRQAGLVPGIQSSLVQTDVERDKPDMTKMAEWSADGESLELYEREPDSRGLSRPSTGFFEAVRREKRGRWNKPGGDG